MKEIHYYQNSETGLNTWFVAVNTYSKTNAPAESGMIETPDINLSWSAWDGESMNNSGEYPLTGTRFYIHEQNGSFFRAEMEQTVGSTVVTRILNGIFINNYDINGTRMYMAYLVDESGMTWSMYARDDALILRSATTSELSAIAGQPVVVERIYRNSSIAGAPGALSSESDLLGSWTATSQMSLKGDGTYSAITGTRTINYTQKNDESGTLFAGTGVYGAITGQELAYSVVNKTIPSGYMYHIICQYEDFYGPGQDYLSYGYEWLSEDTNTMYRIVFWTDASGNNGVSYYVFS